MNAMLSEYLLLGVVKSTYTWHLSVGSSVFSTVTKPVNCEFCLFGVLTLTWTVILFAKP